METTVSSSVTTIQNIPLKVVQKSFKENDTSVLEWHSRNLGLNPLEDLGWDLNARMLARKPINLTQPEYFPKEEWAKLPQEMCTKLVGTYRNRTPAVIKNKGYVIDRLLK